MVSAHVSVHVILLLNHEATQYTCGPYRVWFQHMCPSTSSCFSTMKLHNIHVAHTVYGFSTCAHPRYTDPQIRNYTQHMWPIPCMVSAHVSVHVILLLKHEATQYTCGPYRVWFQHMCPSTSSCFSNMKLHIIHVAHTVYGFSTCVRPRHPASQI